MAMANVGQRLSPCGTPGPGTPGLVQLLASPEDQPDHALLTSKDFHSGDKTPPDGAAISEHTVPIPEGCSTGQGVVTADKKTSLTAKSKLAHDVKDVASNKPNLKASHGKQECTVASGNTVQDASGTKGNAKTTDESAVKKKKLETASFSFLLKRKSKVHPGQVGSFTEGAHGKKDEPKPVPVEPVAGDTAQDAPADGKATVQKEAVETPAETDIKQIAGAEDPDSSDVDTWSLLRSLPAHNQMSEILTMTDTLHAARAENQTSPSVDKWSLLHSLPAQNLDATLDDLSETVEMTIEESVRSFVTDINNTEAGAIAPHPTPDSDCDEDSDEDSSSEDSVYIDTVTEEDKHAHKDLARKVSDKEISKPKRKGIFRRIFSRMRRFFRRKKKTPTKPVSEKKAKDTKDRPGACTSTISRSSTLSEPSIEPADTVSMGSRSHSDSMLLLSDESSMLQYFGRRHHSQVSQVTLFSRRVTVRSCKALRTVTLDSTLHYMVASPSPEAHPSFAMCVSSTRICTLGSGLSALSSLTPVETVSSPLLAIEDSTPPAVAPRVRVPVDRVTASLMKVEHSTPSRVPPTASSTVATTSMTKHVSTKVTGKGKPVRTRKVAKGLSGVKVVQEHAKHLPGVPTSVSPPVATTSKTRHVGTEVAARARPVRTKKVAKDLSDVKVVQERAKHLPGVPTPVSSPVATTSKTRHVGTEVAARARPVRTKKVAKDLSDVKIVQECAKHLPGVPTPVSPPVATPSKTRHTGTEVTERVRPIRTRKMAKDPSGVKVAQEPVTHLPGVPTPVSPLAVTTSMTKHARTKVTASARPVRNRKVTDLSGVKVLREPITHPRGAPNSVSPLVATTSITKYTSTEVTGRAKPEYTRKVARNLPVLKVVQDPTKHLPGVSTKVSSPVATTSMIKLANTEATARARPIRTRKLVKDLSCAKTAQEPIKHHTSVPSPDSSLVVTTNRSKHGGTKVTMKAKPVRTRKTAPDLSTVKVVEEPTKHLPGVPTPVSSPVATTSTTKHVGTDLTERVKPANTRENVTGSSGLKVVQEIVQTLRGVSSQVSLPVAATNMTKYGGTEVTSTAKPVCTRKKVLQKPVKHLTGESSPVSSPIATTSRSKHRSTEVTLKAKPACTGKEATDSSTMKVVPEPVKDLPGVPTPVSSPVATTSMSKHTNTEVTARARPVRTRKAVTDRSGVKVVQESVKNHTGVSPSVSSPVATTSMNKHAGKKVTTKAKPLHTRKKVVDSSSAKVAQRPVKNVSGGKVTKPVEARPLPPLPRVKQLAQNEALRNMTLPRMLSPLPAKAKQSKKTEELPESILEPVPLEREYVKSITIMSPKKHSHGVKGTRKDTVKKAAPRIKPPTTHTHDSTGPEARAATPAAAHASDSTGSDTSESSSTEETSSSETTSSTDPGEFLEPVDPKKIPPQLAAVSPELRYTVEQLVHRHGFRRHLDDMEMPAFVDGSRMRYVKRNGHPVRLGRGVNGQVFLAGLQVRGEIRMVAVKLYPEDTSDWGILWEAYMATHLNPTGATAECYGLVGAEPHEKFRSLGVVFEFLGDPVTYKAMNFNTFMQNQAKVTPKGDKNAPWKYILQMARHLKAISERDVCINDIKFDNVLFYKPKPDAEWTVKYIDVGNALYKQSTYKLRHSPRSRRRHLREFPQLAPEYIMDGKCGPATDMYSLGRLISDAGSEFDSDDMQYIGARCSSHSQSLRYTADELCNKLVRRIKKYDSWWYGWFRR